MSDTTPQDRSRVAYLSSTLFFIVGAYWLLRSLKDPIISTIVGVQYIPTAKICSLFVVLTLVVVYNKLLDMFPKRHHLFYVLGGFYATLFLVISLFLAHPTIGIDNTTADPSRLIGWVSYFAIESFGSLVVQLFWAFVNSSVDLSFAKSYFGYIVAGSQIGSILGPTLATYAPTLGVPLLYFIASILLFLMIYIVYLYVQVHVNPYEDTSDSNGDVYTDQEEGKGMMGQLKAFVKEVKAHHAKEEVANKSVWHSIADGFKLMYKYDYIKGIFGISCLFMIEVTILDYSMKYLAKGYFFDQQYPEDYHKASHHFAEFMGHFGQVTNLVSFLFSLLGTSYVVKSFGIRRALFLFPLGCLFCALYMFANPTLETVFYMMILLKGFSYSLNNPCKEMLYQPTSKDVKFKCKSWIDTFGARLAKATGSIVTSTFSDDVDGLIMYGTVVNVTVASSLIYIAYFMGRQFDALVENNVILGEEEEGEEERNALLGKQNKNEEEDTSCLDQENESIKDMDGGLDEDEKAGSGEVEMSRQTV